MASSAKKPVMDVSKPGGTRADATARPIITGHEIMKDPMMKVLASSDSEATEEPVSSEPEQKELAAPSVTHKVIAPLATEDESEDSPKSKKEETVEESSDSAVMDAVLEQVDDKKVENWRNEEEQKRAELVEKLVDDKKYFLPINQVRSRRNNRIILIIIAILLPLIVGLGLAVDAGIIKPGFTLPFDFIKDKPSANTPMNNATTQTSSPVVAAPAMKGEADADTTKWTSVTSGKKGFMVKIPDGWDMFSYQGKDSLLSMGVSYVKGLPATTQYSTKVSYKDVPRVEIFQNGINDPSLVFNNDTYNVDKSDFTSGSLKGVRYHQKVPLQSNLIGVYAGQEEYTYVFTTQKTVTYVQYLILDYNRFSTGYLPNLTKSDTPQLALIEKLVKTLQIKE